MEPAATIRQVRLEVRTASLALGRELPERLSQLFHGPLLAVLTDELSRVPGPPRHLAELVLELPPIAASRLTRDLPDALRQALRQALAGLVTTTEADSPGGAGSPSRVARGPAGPLAGLHYFLLNGRLPWQLGGPHFNLDAAVARAGRQHPQALRALLRQVGQQVWPRQRLARQLTPGTLDQVIGLLALADAPLVRAYLRDTLAAHRRQPLVPAATPALRQLLHELVLADLLTHWHTQFNRRAFVARQLRQLAAHYNLDFAVLLRQLVAVLPLATPLPPYSPTLPGLVHGLYQELAREAAPGLELLPAGPPAASGAGTGRATPGPAPDAAAALVYYVRYGSLPPTAGPLLTRAALGAEAMRLVSQGREGLLALVQATGPAATAASLRALLSPDQRADLVRRLAPAQTRPVLALLAELTRPPGAGAHRSHLWQQAVALMLATPPAAVLPVLRRWLPLQVPGLLAVAAVSGAAREQLFHYLVAGLAPVPGGALPSPAQLRYILRELLAKADRALPDFLRQQQSHPGVRRRLAALAGAGLLVQLVPRPAHGRPRHAATSGALAALLGEPGAATGARRQQLVREAYLLFHLREPSGAASSLAALRRLPAEYGLPAQALLRYLRQQVRQWPVLASSAFMSWLMSGLAKAAPPPPALIGGRSVPSPEPPVAGAASLANANVDLPTIELAYAPEALATQLPNYGRLWGRRNYAAGWATEVASNATSPPAPPPASLPAASEAQPPAAMAQAHAGAMSPASELGGMPALYLAWPATPAEALARLATYQPSRPTAAGEARPLLKWLAVRQPAAAAAWLSAQQLAAPRWLGAAALLDFGLLRALLAGARPTARQALATLEALAVQELAGRQRLLALLRSAVLLAYFKPTSAGSQLGRLAAAYGLPGQASATRLGQLARRWPALAALPGWEALQAVLRSASQPAASQELHGSATTLAPRAKTVFWAPPAAEALADRAPARVRPNQAAAASQDLVLHYLLHGRAPWWHAGPLLPATLEQALRRAAHTPHVLREFLRQHGRTAPVQRHLATLVDFRLLHELLPPRGRGGRQLVRPALAALDRSLRRPAGVSQERLRVFLQTAYVAYATRSAPVADPLAAARQQAVASGLGWRTVLARTAALLRQHPALAADPFFAALLQATLARSTPGGGVRRAASAKGSVASPTATSAGPAHPPAGAAVEAAWLAVERYLQAGSTAPGARPVLTQLTPAQAAQVLARARPYLGSAAARQRLAELLPTAAEHLLRQWWPASAGPLVQVARGWLRLHRLGVVVRQPASVWEAVLTVGLAGGSQRHQLTALLTHLLRAENPRQPTAQTARQLLQALARRGQRVPGPLAALLAASIGSAASSRPRRSPGPGAAGEASSGPALPPGSEAGSGRPGSLRLRPEVAEAGPAATVYVANAGLVLLWPFLNMLFDRLGYLEQRRFKSPALAERATHLLQFLAAGEENFPEYELVLNKLLCGIETAQPVARAVQLTPEERGLGEDLLRAVLQRWEVLKNTSVAGLRETFLRRGGRLDYHTERVVLTVETKTLDILLDQRPWAISTIRLPWMPLPLYVTWR